MAHKTLINGTSYGISGGKTLIGGTAYAIGKGRTLVGGTGYDISFGTPLSAFAEGDIIYLNENGNPVPFYIAKHNYESGLNGSGRTLLLRCDECGSSYWMNFNSTGVNNYAGGTLDNWLNGTYKARLDANVQSAMSTTKFYYTPGNGNYSVTTLSRSVFALSVTEYGFSDSYANTEGSALPNISIMRACPTDRNYSYYYKRPWTRTPRKYTSTYEHTQAFLIDQMKTSTSCSLGYNGAGATASVRPAFTLPSSFAIST